MKSREQFTAYISKYALSQGILVRDVELCTDISATMVCTVGNEWREHYHNNDWHRTEADAKARAEQMRLAKIASIQKQIARLEKLQF